MSITYPTTLDSFTNPEATSSTATVSHSEQHSNANDAIEALEAKVGVDSSGVATSLDYKLTNTSSSNPGHKHTLANGATDVTATAAELNTLDGITATVGELNTLDGVTATASELNTLDGITATVTELNYVDGVTSAVQGQLDKTKRIYKTVDEIVNNSVTLQDDDELTFSLGANEAWSFTMFLYFDGNSTADLTYKFSVPSGCIVRAFDLQWFDIVDETSTWDTTPFSLPNANVITGTIINSSTAGSFTLQWAQRVATVVDTKIKKGSYIIANKLQ